MPKSTSKLKVHYCTVCVLREGKKLHAKIVAPLASYCWHKHCHPMFVYYVRAIGQNIIKQGAIPFVGPKNVTMRCYFNLSLHAQGLSIPWLHS